MYHLLVLTPEEIVFDGQVKSLIAPGTMGYLGVLANHAPLITSLQSGLVTITNQQQEKLFFQISGGFLEVKHNKAFLLANHIQKQKL